eukprot:TRINITY_DN8527_c0_g1_i10.p1 TRINITY_DN8527_c0_g1~~TRINITY_DN8527_c0_g1_i10.p1  ORF type:complete len:506 (-),score=40.99 TRINITY_DN8527_c0_g1_i10:1384-2901(-)
MNLPEYAVQQIILDSIFGDKNNICNFRLVNKFFKQIVDQSLNSLQPATLEFKNFQNASTKFTSINTLNLQNLAFYENFQTLEGLSQFTNLQNLNLRWPASSQLQCSELGYLPTTLVNLNLELTGTIGSRQIFHPLMSLNQLKKLIIKIEDMFYLDDQNLFVFSLLIKLEEFSLLGQVRMMANSLRILRTLKNMQKIHIESPLRGFSNLAQQDWIDLFLYFPNLEQINFKQNWVGNQFLCAIGQFPQIKICSFKVDIASQWLMTLVGRLTHLEKLEIGLDTTFGLPTDQPTISCMSHANVTSCALWGILSQSEIYNLHQFKQLQNLTISCNNTGGAYLNILSKLTQLTKLSLTGTGNHNLNFLSNLILINNLTIKAHSRIGMKDLDPIRNLSSLQILDLEGTMDSDSLNVLHYIQNLQNLTLGSNNLYYMDLSKPLAQICEKKSLIQLKIVNLKVSREIVDSICVLNSNLQSVKLVSCRVAEGDLTLGFLRLFFSKVDEFESDSIN